MPFILPAKGSVTLPSSFVAICKSISACRAATKAVLVSLKEAATVVKPLLANHAIAICVRPASFAAPANCALNASKSPPVRSISSANGPTAAPVATVSCNPSASPSNFSPSNFAEAPANASAMRVISLSVPLMLESMFIPSNPASKSPVTATTFFRLSVKPS